MRILKTASGKRQIKLSKSEWEQIGKKAGWMKEAEFEFNLDNSGLNAFSNYFWARNKSNRIFVIVNTNHSVRSLNFKEITDPHIIDKIINDTSGKFTEITVDEMKRRIEENQNISLDEVKIRVEENQNIS
jgi:hypothetical protein